MCVGTCARILGPCLFILGLLSIIANTLLLFPSLEWCYLKEGQITKNAVLMPGVWGGGLLVSGYFSGPPCCSSDHNCWMEMELFFQQWHLPKDMGKPRKNIQKNLMAAPWKEPEKQQDNTTEESTSGEESAMEDAEGEMAAKKQGSSRSIQDIGKNNDMKSFLHQLRKDLQADMEAVVAPLQSMLLEIKSKLDGVERTANSAMELAQEQEEKVSALGSELKQLQDKLEDQENRNRRNNLRLRGFKEGEKSQELKAIILKWIKELIPDLEISEMHLEQVHRVGGKEIKGRRRDIIVRFAFYTMKTDVYRALRDMQSLMYEEEQIEIYQDLASETVQKRKNWKKYTELLRNENIRYTWGFPFKLSIWYGRTPIVVTKLPQLEAFFERKKIQLPESSKETKGKPHWNIVKGRNVKK
ncbi:hypothetical protein lerEdw1_008067 [Lerista edwardsae]|nr:hypothetical protein lerEdw1_008067 [Lerista edwardsae]